MTGPMARGTWLALLAALAFGVTAPLLARVTGGVGPFATACLLYAGAALVSLPAVRRAGFARSQLPRLVAIALAGAVLAPAALAWGLARTGGLTASLLLNAEAVFTVLLAWLVHREHVGARVALALLLMLAAGSLLVVGGSGSFALSLGALAVLGATLGWALDNTLTRKLADLDSGAVVLLKASLGAVVSAGLALALGQRWPDAVHALAILGLGAAGYGLSLRLYLLAQRQLGAGRTGSIFAVGPFIGALIAPLLGEPLPGWTTWLAGALFAAGVVLHLTERHGHRHRHAALDHDHVHRHDDGHHDHVHDPPVTGKHAHPHHHDALEHDHPHAPDLHHQHDH